MGRKCVSQTENGVLSHRPFHVFFFSIFDMDKFRKIRQHHSKQHLKISKIAKFVHDLLTTNEDIPASKL